MNRSLENFQVNCANFKNLQIEFLEKITTYLMKRNTTANVINY